MNDFKPFENDTQSINVGPGEGLTIENGVEEIIVYGDIEITKETPPEDIEKIIAVLTTIKNSIK